MKQLEKVFKEHLFEVIKCWTYPSLYFTKRLFDFAINILQNTLWEILVLTHSISKQSGEVGPSGWRVPAALGPLHCLWPRFDMPWDLLGQHFPVELKCEPHLEAKNNSHIKRKSQKKQVKLMLILCYSIEVNIYNILSLQHVALAIFKGSGATRGYWLLYRTVHSRHLVCAQ